MKTIIVHKRIYGVSLLEVVIAAFIFAVASLGFTKLKVMSISLTQAAHNKMVAESISNDFQMLIENYTFPIKGKNNIDDVLNDFISFDFNTVNCDNPVSFNQCLNGDLGSSCSRNQMLEAERYIMSCNAKTSLPSAEFNIASCGTDKYCIYVAWMGEDATEANCSSSEGYCIKSEVYY